MNELETQIRILVDRLHRIQKIVDDADRDDDPVILDIEEVLQEMNYDYQ